MVIDLSKTDPDGFADEDRPKLADPMSMVITEVSVADVSAGASAHSGYPGKFKAFTEDKTLSYFKDMGVTHLQLMPSDILERLRSEVIHIPHLVRILQL